MLCAYTPKQFNEDVVSLDLLPSLLDYYLKLHNGAPPVHHQVKAHRRFRGLLDMHMRDLIDMRIRYEGVKKSLNRGRFVEPDSLFKSSSFEELEVRYMRAQIGIVLSMKHFYCLYCDAVGVDNLLTGSKVGVLLLLYDSFVVYLNGSVYSEPRD